MYLKPMFMEIDILLTVCEVKDHGCRIVYIERDISNRCGCGIVISWYTCIMVT